MKSHAGQGSAEGLVRPCGAQDRSAVLRIINRAAEAYHGVIPEDRFHDPYMSEQELAHEMADGVIFCGYEAEGLVGVMGVQAKANVDLIRHAYVLPGRQGGGVGSALLAHLRRRTERPILVGAWRAPRVGRSASTSGTGSTVFQTRMWRRCSGRTGRCPIDRSRRPSSSPRRGSRLATQPD